MAHGASGGLSGLYQNQLDAPVASNCTHMEAHDVAGHHDMTEAWISDVRYEDPRLLVDSSIEWNHEKPKSSWI